MFKILLKLVDYCEDKHEKKRVEIPGYCTFGLFQILSSLSDHFDPQVQY